MKIAPQSPNSIHKGFQEKSQKKTEIFKDILKLI
jgi:hypothetical protein